MEVEAGHRLDDTRLREIHRDTVGLRLLDEVREVGEPPLQHQEGARPVSGPHGPPDDFLALREIQPALRLDLGAQGNVGQREVVTNAFVGRVGDLDRHVRSPALSGPHQGTTILAIARTPTTTITLRSTTGDRRRPYRAPTNPPRSAPVAIRAATSQSTRSGATTMKMTAATALAMVTRTFL